MSENEIESFSVGQLLTIATNKQSFEGWKAEKEREEIEKQK
ncbi:hypothetical protein QFC96_10580 (plasmid) [Latilactobacillus curvatus]|nr:hypothetical protein [Latilactobacillus curvatus]WHQ77616.1 hypothetical protein QFC96_06875 [Latilactobacillus curvatus]WHQ79289.1 hypothetical protein QFC96_10580 [Latilactobacillus curvatus]